jgi:hypothetical protein
MWDPGKFYDDLEHSIFEKILTCVTLLIFIYDLEQSVFKIMLTFGTDVGL